jgi:hypothetical protein
MIRIQLVHEGRVVKTISSRVHEAVILEQVKRYGQPIDEIRVIEGELTEAGKGILHHVAKKIIPAAMAAGMALGGANLAHAQNAGSPGQNRNFPGLEMSVGQHLNAIFSPNYQEIMRRRNYELQTQREVWNAEQAEIRRARVDQARAQGRAEMGLPPAGQNANMHVYDQARTSSDGKFFIIYGMDNSITRIPVQGTEFMPGDSQRLPHYIAPSGRVFYVRHPAGTMTESIISEGTWALPDSPEAVDELTALMQRPLVASLAADKLYGLVGDDHLFDLIAAMKEQNPGQNIWKNPAVARRFHELGIDINVAEGFGTIGTIPASGVMGRGQSANGQTANNDDEVDLQPGQNGQVAQAGSQPTGKTTTLHIDQNGQLSLGDEEEPAGLKESTDDLINIIMAHQADVKRYTGGNGTNMSPDLSQELQAYYKTNNFAQQFDHDLANIFHAVDSTAPATESVTESVDPQLQAILDQYADSFAKFKSGGDLDENPDFFDALFSYYLDSGEMPYGVAKAREGDPVQWIADRLEAEVGLGPVEEAMTEGAEFGAYYSEELAQKVFDQNPGLSCTGRCEELLDAAWPIAVADLGKKRAQHEFSYSEDFPSDFVSAYSHLQKQQPGVAEGADDEASSDDQASADKNIIMQIRKVADYERPMAVNLADGEAITIDADTAQTILAKFDTLKPDGKALMQQTLNTGEGFRELLNYFNKREVHEDVELISTAMKPVLEANARAKRLMKTVFGI